MYEVTAMDVGRIPTLHTGRTPDFEWLKHENLDTVQRAYNLAMLAAMCELQKGWDGNKAERISKDIIS